MSVVSWLLKLITYWLIIDIIEVIDVINYSDIIMSDILQKYIVYEFVSFDWS